MTNPHPPTLSLTTISHSPPASRWRTEALRSHASGRLIYITAGQGRVTVAGLSSGYGPDNLIYIPPYTLYAIEIRPAGFGQILTLPDDTTGWPDDSFHLRLSGAAPQRNLMSLMEAIERELQPTGDARASLHHFGLLGIFVERQLAQSTATPDIRRKTAAAKLVAAYTALIAKDFRTNRNVASYAAALNVSATHLARSCRHITTRSALSLLQDRRYFEACTLLRDTTMPIQDIAQKLGFSSPAYFTRRFCEHAGQPPRDFRNKRS